MATPNTAVTYYRLRPGKGYLKGIDVGPDESVDTPDITDAEEQAKEEIDETLDIAFDNSDLDLIPKTIKRLAHMLAASFVCDLAERNNDEHTGIAWREEARATLRAIRDGHRGLKMPDGSWHHRFRAREEGRGGKLEIISG